MAHHDTREGWLVDAGNRLISKYVVGMARLTMPPWRVSCGFPKGSRGRGAAKRIGECWSVEAAADEHANIFISPVLDDGPRILDVLLHELIHAGTPGAGHKGAFVAAAKAVGLVAPWTATTASDTLAAELSAMAKEIGSYPHGAMVIPEGKRPGSRLRLWECPCGIKVRVSSDDFQATCGLCDEAFERR